MVCLSRRNRRHQQSSDRQRLGRWREGENVVNLLKINEERTSMLTDEIIYWGNRGIYLSTLKRVFGLGKCRHDSPSPPNRKLQV